MADDIWELRDWDEPRHLNFSVSFDGPDTCVLNLSGEVDCANAAALDAVLEGLHAVGIRHANVDGREIEFIDCAGLRVLMSQARRFNARGGGLSLEPPGPHLTRLMALTDTGGYFVGV